MAEIQSLNQKIDGQETSSNQSRLEVEKPGGQPSSPLEIETSGKDITELFQASYSISELGKSVKSESGELKFTPLTPDSSTVIRLAASSEGVRTMLPEVPISESKETSKPQDSNMIEFRPIAKVGERTPYQEALLRGAEKHLGSKPWEKSRYKDYVGDGKIAGGASVVEVLKSMGLKIDGANPAKIVARLIAQGWTMYGIKQAKPGDLVFGGKKDTNWQEGSGNADIGIVGSENNSVYQIDESTGKWSNGSLESLLPKDKYGGMMWVLRPPANLPAKESSQNSPSNRPGADGIKQEDLPGGAVLKPNESGYKFEPRESSSQKNDAPSTLKGDPESRYWHDYWSEYHKNKWKDHYSNNGESNTTPGSRRTDVVPKYHDSDLRPDPMGIRKNGNVPPYYSDDRRREQTTPSEQSDRYPSSSRPLAGRTIALAAGHGGKDSGTVHHGFREKDFTLSVTRRIARELEQLGATVKLTRSSDVYISPPQIKSKFNQFRPDIALAIHADSAGKSTSGILTMYSKQDSKALAYSLQKSIVSETGAGDRGVRYQTHAHTGKEFQSTNPNAPAVFLELANLANRREAQKIQDPAYQDKLAKAVAKGVLRYLGPAKEYRRVS